MTVSQALEKLSAYEKLMFTYNHASGLMYYDGATVAPRGSADLRADTLGELARLSYALTTAPETVEMLRTLVEARDRLDPVTARKVSEIKYDAVYCFFLCILLHLSVTFQKNICTFFHLMFQNPLFRIFHRFFLNVECQHPSTLSYKFTQKERIITVSGCRINTEISFFHMILHKMMAPLCNLISFHFSHSFTFS